MQRLERDKKANCKRILFDLSFITVKRILIISYYFPPCNIVSAQRARSFAENFKRHGLYPVIATRHWTGDENSTAGYESENLSPPAVTEFEDYTLIQLPYAAQLSGPLQRALTRNKTGKHFLYSLLYASGTVNPKCNVDATFGEFLDAYLSKNPVDYILATAFPMNALKLGSRLAQMFTVPFIADFRDLWDNGLLSKNYSPPLPERLQNAFYEFYLRRWLAPARLITAVSEPLFGEIDRVAPQAKKLLVTNGFEGSVFADARERFAPSGDAFVFSVVGTLEAKLDLSVMIAGLQRFLAVKSSSDVRLNFIGAEAFPEVAARLKNELPLARVTGRISRDEAIRITAESHVLFHAGWRGYRGMASGKIYEYLGAGRNILIAPDDHDVMHKIVTETRAGKLVDTPDEFTDVMNGWFDEWKATGSVAYKGIDSKIEYYTREKQAEKLARAILEIE